MSAQGLWMTIPLLALALGLAPHRAGRRPGRGRGGPAGPSVPRQAARARQLAGAAASRRQLTELTELIDASDSPSCPHREWTLERGCECDPAESARLLSRSF